MLLYDSAVSGNCYKVRLLFAHLGLAYERRELSVIDRSNLPEVFGDGSPALRVPTLVLDDGRTLAESNAMRPASTWATIPRSAPGWIESPPSPGTSRSPLERLVGLCARGC
jgi:hypothetical protein